MRVLLIEDEAKVSSFVSRGLTAERFAVDVARDGKTGLELAQTYEYDMIVLDLMLPGLPGTEVLRQVRRTNSKVPVLVLTARDAIQDKVENFEAGAITADGPVACLRGCHVPRVRVGMSSVRSDRTPTGIPCPR